MLTKQVKLIPIDSIQVDRASRQRREIDVSDLLESVKRRGVLTPICVTRSRLLVFGERRLTAAKQCGHTEILARIAPDDLSPHDLQLLELEENLMRQELPWQDRARAMARLYELSGAASESIFAESIGYSVAQVNRTLAAAHELARGNDRVASAPSIQKAVNIVQRQREREHNHMLADIVDTIQGPASPATPREDAESVFCTDFIEAVATYIGPKFNLIHFDPPYGIDLDESDQLQSRKDAETRGSAPHRTYADDEATFWRLLGALAGAQANMISTSAHMIFWFSMKHHDRLRAELARRFSEWTFDEYPLIWHKTDNKGLVPDVTRRPRRVYETALFGWRGDRKIVKLVANAYGAPKEAGSHPSAKPEPMLRHFFQMVVDPSTRLLDPTCGSGSALRAAEALGAERVLGLEIDPEWAATASARLRAARRVATLAENVT